MFGFGMALITSFCNIYTQVQIFIKGITNETIIFMLLIFLLTGAFFSVLCIIKDMGGIEATVNMGLSLLRNGFLLLAIFIIPYFVLLAMGTIATCGPYCLLYREPTDL